VVFVTRELLIRQRTQLINELRGRLAEFGFVVRQGAAHTARLMDVVDGPARRYGCC
jgi:transposase